MQPSKNSYATKIASLSVPYLFSHLSQAFVYQNTFAFVHQHNVLSFYSRLRCFVHVSLHERSAQCSTSHFVLSLPCLRTLFPVHVRPRSSVNVQYALNLLHHCHRLSQHVTTVVHAALQCFHHALGWDQIGVVTITHPFSTLSPTLFFHKRVKKRTYVLLSKKSIMPLSFCLLPIIR